MHPNVKTAVKAALVTGGIAIYINRTRNRNKITAPSTAGIDPDVYKAVAKLMLNEIEYGVYDDVPFTQENFDAIFRMKCELYTK